MCTQQRFCNALARIWSVPKEVFQVIASITIRGWAVSFHDSCFHQGFACYQRGSPMHMPSGSSLIMTYRANQSSSMQSDNTSPRAFVPKQATNLGILKSSKVSIKFSMCLQCQSVSCLIARSADLCNYFHQPDRCRAAEQLLCNCSNQPHVLWKAKLGGSYQMRWHQQLLVKLSVTRSGGRDRGKHGARSADVLESIPICCCVFCRGWPC